MKAPPPLLRVTPRRRNRSAAGEGRPTWSERDGARLAARQLERGEGAVTLVAGEPADLERFLEVFRFAEPVPA